MRYKMLCTDLDGTLLALKNQVSPFCASVFKKYSPEIKIVLVSARMPSGMHYIQKTLGVTHEPIVCYNGALVMKGSKVLSSTQIGLDLVSAVYHICQENNVAMGLYAFNEWHAPENSERIQKEEFNTQTKVVLEPSLQTIDRWQTKGQGAHKLMLMGTKASADHVFIQLEKTFLGRLGIYRSNDSLIEISPASVDKLSGIKTLLNQDIHLNEVMAFGDNFNDLKMLEGVGLGVAVENARDALKKKAKQTIKSCQEDGVAYFLKDYFTNLKE